MKHPIIKQDHSIVSPQIGFYTPDPGKRSPMVLLATLNDKVLVYEPRSTFVSAIDSTDWAPIDLLKLRVQQVVSGPRHGPGGPMEQFRDRLVDEYLLVFLEAIELAPQLQVVARDALNNHAAVARSVEFVQ